MTQIESLQHRSFFNVTRATKTVTWVGASHWFKSRYGYHCNKCENTNGKQWYARVKFVKSESNQSQKPFEPQWSESHLKFFRFESKSSYDLVESSKRRVTKSVESLRVIGWQARVNVESNEI